MPGASADVDMAETATSNDGGKAAVATQHRGPGDTLADLEAAKRQVSLPWRLQIISSASRLRHV